MIPTRSVFRRFFVCLILGLALAGCAKPSMQLDALSASESGAMPDVRYLILPGSTEVRADDLLFIEYKEHLAAVLRGLGCEVTEDSGRATAIVLLSWLVRDTEVYYGNNSPSVGIGAGWGNSGYGPGWGNGNFFGLGLGFPVGGEQGVTRHRYMVVLDALAANPNSTTDKSKSLWKVMLSSQNSSDSPRVVIPAMLDAAGPYIGKDTRGPVTVTLDEK